MRLSLLSPSKALRPAGAGSAEDEGLESRVQCWLEKIRRRLPDGSTLVVTVHQSADQQFLLSFRANVGGETYISEVRRPALEAALEEAGRNLQERLLLSPPEPRTFGSRLRNLFMEVG